MKVAWNDLKAKFKEQLRVVGKYDLNKPNDYLVKRRQFKDIDISKDFERRLMSKKILEEQEKKDAHSISLELMTLDQLEAYREKLVIKEESEKKEDIYQKVILRDLQ